MKALNINNYITEVTAWLKTYAEKAGLKGFVLGVSGGVDSAVVSTLCARTGMPVLCLEMPIHQDPSHTVRSTNHINWLKQQFPEVTSVNIDLTTAFDVMRNTLHDNMPFPNDKGELADANIRSRLRMITSYFQANCYGFLVAGTGNKVEDFGVGYFTLGGDGQVDLSPLGDITKTEVWNVARALGVNQEIIDAKPTDGLWSGSPSDEDQIGASYPELEWAMEFKRAHIDPLGDGAANSSIEALVAVVSKKETENVGRKQEVMRIYLNRNRANQHKMNPIPVFETQNCRR
jgi:NAD+ synthase